MVQQFAPEILSPGEGSLVFLRGEYSHAVVKSPTPGDFRVQWQFGGTAKVAEPSRRLTDAARRVFAALPELPLYARVDGTEDGESFVLMEVELIEPVLFLGHGGAAPRLAEAIADFPT